MAQVAEKLQPWLAALDERPARRFPLASGSARSRGARASSSWDFRRRATRSGASRTSRRSRRPSSGSRRRRSSTRRSSTRFSTRTRRSGSSSVNGRVAPELSRTAGLPPGLKFGSLATACTEQADIVGRYLGQLADPNTRAFAALNTAFTHDGAYVDVPDGLVFEQPLQILFVSTSDGAGRLDVPPADAHRRRRPQPAADRRDLRQRGGADALHERRDRDRRAARAP